MLLLLCTEQVMDIEQVNDESNADESMSVENSDTLGSDTQGGKSSSSSGMPLMCLLCSVYTKLNRMKQRRILVSFKKAPTGQHLTSALSL